MNILHLIHGRVATGPAAAAITDAECLIAAGHKVWLASGADSKLAQSCAAKSIPNVAGLKLGKGARRLLNAPHDMRKLREILRELAIDVLHIHRSDDQLLAGLSLGKTLSTIMVRSWHRNPGTIPRILLKKLASHTEGCICVAREHAATLTETGARAEFIHGAVDTSIFKPGSDVAQRVPPRIGHVGRWKRDRSGVDRGQRAVLEIFSKIPPVLAWQGLLIGRGEMADNLRRAISDELRLPRDRVMLLDTEKKSLPEFVTSLASLRLGLVLAPGSDGTSRAALEMLACGVPLLLSNLPGLREIGEDESCASVQLPADANGWAAKIIELLRDPARLNAMSAAARVRAEKYHSLKTRGEALAEFYRK